jgi:hypothetical protein
MLAKRQAKSIAITRHDDNVLASPILALRLLHKPAVFAGAMAGAHATFNAQNMQWLKAGPNHERASGRRWLISFHVGARASANVLPPSGQVRNAACSDVFRPPDWMKTKRKRVFPPNAHLFLCKSPNVQILCLVRHDQAGAFWQNA